MKRISTTRFLLFLYSTFSIASSYKLRVMKVVMSNDPHSGMDGGMLGKRVFGYGGDFDMTICSSSDGENEECCKTGELNTSDDNWELGETNYFIGHQLNKCEDFDISTSAAVSVKIQHQGSDGGKIDHIKLRGALRNKNELLCEVNKKLDNSESVTVTCTSNDKNSKTNGQIRECMGNYKFCDTAINKFSFAGSHNAGTGMSGSVKPIECLFKNHDLTFPEQLDFGIRFFDMDLAYSQTLPGCNGLETVHGKGSMYYCFGSVKHLFSQVIEWANDNPNEVILLHFGSLYKGNVTLNPLIKQIKESFPDTSAGVKLNRMFQESGKWPTLGEAVDRNERIFIFIVQKYSDYTNVNEDDAQDYIKVYKVDDEDAGKPKPVLKRGWASFASTYGSGKIGSNCDKVVETVSSLCDTLDADFIKVATYGTPWKSLNLVFKKSSICIDTYARLCNVRAKDIMTKCKQSKQVLNVVLSDYPNYPSTSDKTLPELVDEENSS